MALLNEVARKYHEHYQATVLSVMAKQSELSPGGFALLFQPRSNKLFVCCSEPYLILGTSGSTMTLQYLATGITLEEHISSVRPLHWHDTVGE